MDFMGLTIHELITILHGMVMGGIVLLLFPVVLAQLWCLRPEWITNKGLKKYLTVVKGGTWVISIFSWLTVIIGSYLPYSWYRLKPPISAQLMTGRDLMRYPAAYLIAHPNLSAWEEVAMEWKEHAGWIVPILTTAVAFILTYYNSRLLEEPKLRKILFTFLALAFVVAAMCGLLGALITKIAPVR